jgi:hypothetical protein
MGCTRIEVRVGEGEWLAVGGVALPLAGAARYRVLITSGWSALRAAAPESILVRVDGAIAVEVVWTGRPEGFAICEVFLGSGTFRASSLPPPSADERAAKTG